MLGNYITKDVVLYYDGIHKEWVLWLVYCYCVFTAVLCGGLGGKGWEVVASVFTEV